MSRFNYEALQKAGEANCFKFSTQKFHMPVCRVVTFYSGINVAHKFPSRVAQQMKTKNHPDLISFHLAITK